MPLERAPLLFAEQRVAAIAFRKGRFHHTFGGPLRPQGTDRSATGGRRLHQLFDLDLTDPAIPEALRKLGLTRIPLLYCFDFRVNRFGYRCLEDGTVHVFFWKKEQNVSRKEAFPSDPFPDEFPQRAVSLKREPYDPASSADALRFAGVFGLAGLARPARTRVLKEQRTWFENLNGEPPESESALEAWLSGPFLQGRPNSRCPNPECRWHRVSGGLNPFCVVPSEPVPGVSLFGAHGGIQVVYERCPACEMIVASNQSG